MITPPILPENALRPALVVTHPRSGTHLLLDLLRRQFSSFRNWRWWGMPLDHLYLNLERLGSENRFFDERIATRIVRRPRRALMKTHFGADFTVGWAADEAVPPPEHWRDLALKAHIFYVVRHPLDVMTSYRQFLRGIDAKLAEQDFVSFLKAPHWQGQSDRIGWWADHVLGWASDEGVAVLRYEDIVDDTESVLERIAEQLGEHKLGRMPLLPSKITSISRTRFDRVIRLSPESTAIVSDRNRFPADNWRVLLKRPDKSWIEERTGAVLHRFGYTLDPARPVSPPNEFGSTFIGAGGR